MPRPVPATISAFTEVVVPCTPEGMVSAPDQETLVRWLRGQGFAGVVLQGPFSHADRFDLLEREEIYGSWRSGLPPSIQVLTAVPPGWQTPDGVEGMGADALLLFHAGTAREWGTDGLVLPHWVETPRLTQDLREMELTVLQAQPRSNLLSPIHLNPVIAPDSDSAPVTVFPSGAFLGCLARQTGERSVIQAVDKFFGEFPPEAAPQLGLWTVEWGGIITGGGSFDPYCPPIPSDAKQRLCQLLVGAGLLEGFLKAP